MLEASALLAKAREAFDAGLYRDAHTKVAEALRGNPNSVDGYLLLGDLAVSQGALLPAIDIFRQAISLSPKRSEGLVRLATVFVRLNRPAEARQSAEQALALGVGDAALLDELGVSFSRLNDHQRSIAIFKSAAERSKSPCQSLFNLACAYQIVGDFDAAEIAARRCLTIEAQFSAAYLLLAEMNRQWPDDMLISKLEGLFEKASGDQTQQLVLGHAIARSLENRGEAVAAIDWLARANALHREASPYDRERDQALFASAASTPATVTPSPHAPLSNRPVFIVGMPRSGTTLVDRILSSHPDIASIGESMTFPLLIKQIAGDTSPGMMSADTFRRAATKDLSRVGQDYLRAAESIAGPEKRIVDKLPFNFFYVDLIRRALPRAKIICLRRDPIDVCLSNYRLLFSQSSPFHDYAYDLEDIAHYYLGFKKLVDQWKRVPPQLFFELHYEALVQDQLGLTRQLLEFCELPFDAACLDFQTNRSPVATASAGQVRRPLFNDSIGRWKTVGPALEPLIAVLRNGGALEEPITSGS